MDSGTKPEDKQWFTREQAIAVMTQLDADMDDDELDEVDYVAMTNEDLEGELCLSGYIHDEDLGGIK